MEQINQNKMAIQPIKKLFLKNRLSFTLDFFIITQRQNIIIKILYILAFAQQTY